MSKKGYVIVTGKLKRKMLNSKKKQIQKLNQQQFQGEINYQKLINHLQQYNIQTNSQPLFKLIKTPQIVRQYDIYLIGQCYLIILKINHYNHLQEVKQTKIQKILQLKQQLIEGVNHIQSQMPCILCLNMTYGDDELPIVLSCKCSGTMNSYHSSCIIQWIQTQNQLKLKKFKNIDVVSFNSKSYFCRLCNSYYKECNYKSQINHPILDFKMELPICPFIIIYVTDIHMNQYNKILIKYTKDQKIFFGRHIKLCQIIIKNKNTSRMHGSFYFENNNWTIQDEQSTFGIWKYVKKSEQITEGIYKKGHNLVSLKNKL